MSKRGMRILEVVAALVLAAGSPCAAADEAVGAPVPVDVAHSLQGVTVSADSQGRPVVTLVGDGPLDYEEQVLEKPDRLVLDLAGVVSRIKAHQFPVGRDGVVRVRAGQYRSDPEPVSRVVVDLENPLPHRIERNGSSLVLTFEGRADAAPTPETTAQTQHGPEVGSESPAIAAAPPPAQERPEAPAAQSEPSEPAAEPEPAAPATAAAAGSAPSPTEAKTEEAARPAPARSVPAETLDSLLGSKPALQSSAATPSPTSEDKAVPTAIFETRTIATDAVRYSGKRISLNLVDADVKQVFRLFHEISGLNFVLDPSVDGRVTIVLDQVPWDQALDIILRNNGLDKVFENNVIRIASTQKLAAEAASRKQLKEAKELEVEPTTVTRTLSYAKAKEVEKVIREGGILSPRGKVIVDDRTNTLIISDIPKKVEPLDKLISSLDAETPQVMIEARIVETSKQFVQDFGVVWNLNAIADASRGTSTNAPFPKNASVKYGLNLPGAGGASSLAFKLGNILDSFTLDMTLNALETDGRGRILSSPRIATQNNERAEIEQGIRIPVVNTTATEINVEFVSASLRLAVTPQITAEGTIILDIQVENNSPDFVNRVGDVPPIRTQRAQTKILIGDGGTTVIGGIFTVNEAKSESGVPWFRKIPVLGWAFKQRNITNENRELLIFITPKIMKIG